MKVKIQDLERIARRELGFVSTSGIDGLGEQGRRYLDYGLEEGLFTRGDVDAAQAIYTDSCRK